MPVELKPIQRKTLTFKIVGTSPLIQHKWSDKALKMLRDKGGGRKTKVREARDPQTEADAATYYTADGEHGLPILALKTAIIGAAHKDLGVEKTLVRKALFFPCDDPGKIVPMEFDEIRLREDPVRVGMGSADLRYRPEFTGWRATVTVEIDADLLRTEDVVNLVNRAGFGVGIGEWRPEKGGEYGRFEVDTNTRIEERT